MPAASPPIRYGVIGTGMMGIEHIANVAALEGTLVTAVADTNQTSRARGVAAAGGQVRAFADHGELLASGLCDAIVVATPNHTHVDIVADVLATDLHALIEKPLCTTVADCERLVELEARRPQKSITWVGLEYRFMPATAELIRLVHYGTIGRPRMVAMREHRYPFLRKVADWNRLTTHTGASSAGVARRAALRGEVDDEGYVERHRWTGVGRARSGAGAAIVGDPDHALGKILELADAGIEVFILSGYPHAAECDLFARYVLPLIDHGRLEFNPDPVNPD